MTEALGERREAKGNRKEFWILDWEKIDLES